MELFWIKIILFNKMEELSDDQKFSNYCRLLEAIEYMESGGKITEDWMEAQKEHIEAIGKFFVSGFKSLNPEVNNGEFRATAEQSDVLLNSLLTSIYYDKTFEVRHYKILLNKILLLFKLTQDIYGNTDELSEFMNNMTLG